MPGFSKIFFRGLLTLLPIAITIYIIYSVVKILDGVFDPLLRFMLPDSLYFQGMGFVLMLISIYIFGLMVNNFFTARFFAFIETKLVEVPFIKAIYSPLRDLMNLFSKRDQQMGSVVLVRMGETGAKALGLVTRESFQDLPALEKNAGQKVAVYFPLSYGLGGFTFLVPADQLEKIDLPVERAMSLAITGWVHMEDKK